MADWGAKIGAKAMLTATVSGSFHRHLTEIMRAVTELGDMGVKVMSPSDPRVVDNVGEFLFVASDRMRSVRLVQDRHLESIRTSDFLWLVAPDGYVGQSAAMELGFAAAHRVPILALTLPTDLTLRQYATKVDSLTTAVATIAHRSAHHGEKERRFLIDPHATLQDAHATLDKIGQAISEQELQRANFVKPVRLYSECNRIAKEFTLPVE
jgi:hypothetical protein